MGMSEGKDHYEDEDVSGRIIVKWILERQYGVVYRVQWRSVMNTALELRIP
jgi:hypothetical protein